MEKEVEEMSNADLQEAIVDAVKFRINDEQTAVAMAKAVYGVGKNRRKLIDIYQTLKR